MATEPLQNLTEQSARVGAWVLSVASNPRTEVYSFDKGTGKGNGMKFECLLVSDNSEEYCLGQFRRKGKEPRRHEGVQRSGRTIQKGYCVEGEQTISRKEGQYISRLFTQSPYRHERI